MSVCIFDPMLRPVLTVCDMNEADKTMRKYWLVAVMLLALCWGAEAERERTHTLDSLGRERDELLVEVKTLQENTLIQLLFDRSGYLTQAIATRGNPLMHLIDQPIRQHRRCSLDTTEGILLEGLDLYQ